MLEALTTLERAELVADVTEAGGDARALPRILTVAVLLGEASTRNRALAVYSSCGFDARLAGSLLWPELERLRGGPKQALERVQEAAAELQRRVGPPSAAPAAGAPSTLTPAPAAAIRTVSRPPEVEDAGPLPADFRIYGKTWAEVLAAGMDPSVMDIRRLFAEAANASKAGLLDAWKTKNAGAWG